MKAIIKGKAIAEITGAFVVADQIKILNREGFTFWLDAKQYPRMYEGQLPKQYDNDKPKLINNNGFRLANGS